MSASFSTAYLNQQFLPLSEARVSPMDRGFLFADGIYEVIPVYAGKLFRLEEHLDRLDYSLREIQLKSPLSRGEWRAMLEQLVQKNGGGNMSVYLQVTRGEAAVREHAFPPAGTQPTVFAMCSPISKPKTEDIENAVGGKAITVTDIRWLRCDIKSVSLLPNILMRQKAVEAGAAEAIFIRDGQATEGSASNLFIVKDGRLITPPKSHFILGGITRDLILELATVKGFPFVERAISETELRSADEVWVSSSTREILPITELDGAPVANGEIGLIWKQFATLYVNYKASLFEGK